MRRLRYRRFSRSARACWWPSGRRPRKWEWLRRLRSAAAPNDLWLVWWIGVFAFALRCFGPANYGIFAAALSALIVLLFAATGIAPQTVIATRAWNTLAGGVIALGAYVAWPTWERARVREVLATLLESYRRYFQLVCDAYLAPSAPFDRALDRTRLAGRLARSNLEASLNRLRTEPGAAPDSIAAFTLAIANSHRFIHMTMSLEAGLSSSPIVPARPEFGPSRMMSIQRYTCRRQHCGAVLFRARIFLI